MIKKYVYLLGIFLICSPLLYASPVGNIAKPAMLESVYIHKDEDSGYGFIAEAEFDIGIDRGVKNQTEDSTFTMEAGKFGVSFADTFIIYGLAGVAKYEETVSLSSGTVKFETATKPAYGVGATILFFERPFFDFEDLTIAFGIDGRYRETDFDLATVRINGTHFDNPESNSSLTNVLSDYRDWQLAAAVAFRWKRLIPYIGVKYFKTDAIFRVTNSGVTHEDQAELDENIGMFIGVDALLYESFSLNAEFRFLDEEAFTLGGAIRF